MMPHKIVLIVSLIILIGVSAFPYSAEAGDLPNPFDLDPFGIIEDLYCLDPFNELQPFDIGCGNGGPGPGNGGNGGGNGDNGGPPPPPPCDDTCYSCGTYSECGTFCGYCPPTVYLNGDETVEVPDPIALSWSSSNTDSCSASGDWSGAKPTSGSETIKSKTTTADRGDYYYSLSCSGPGGSASDGLAVKVIQVPRCVFTANPENIILPQFSTLAWECEYCIPGTAYINQGIGDVDCSGSQPVRPDKTTSYILSASGWDGQRLFQADVGVGFRPVIREIIPR